MEALPEAELWRPHTVPGHRVANHSEVASSDIGDELRCEIYRTGEPYVGFVDHG